MTLQMDPLENQLATHTIMMGLEISYKLYQHGRFGRIDHPDHQF